MSIFDLTGRTAVITGGNGGIGLGIAQALNAQGCNVSIWGRNAEKNKSAAATMSAGPGKVHTQVCDVSDPASVKAAMIWATTALSGRTAMWSVPLLAVRFLSLPVPRSSTGRWLARGRKSGSTAPCICAAD